MPERVERSFRHIFLFENQTDLALNKRTKQFEPVFADRDSRMVFKLKIFQFFQVGTDFINCSFLMMISSISLFGFSLALFAAGLEIIDDKAKSEPISD